jgi:Flp pilus assembly protein CpaB
MLRGFRTSRVYVAASLVLAVCAALLFRSYVTGLSDASAGGGRGVPVVVAARAVERGQVLSASDLQLAEWPEALAPPGSFRQISQPAGRTALTDLALGEAVTETRLARVRAGPVASLVPQGLRALAVPTTLPGGSVVAGDRVDVLATYQGDPPRTETVASAVEVLLVLDREGPAGRLGAGSSADVGLDAAASGAPGSPTLILLVPMAEQGRLASARAFASLEVTIAPGGQ